MRKVVMSLAFVAASLALALVSFRLGAYYDGSGVLLAVSLILQAGLAAAAWRTSWVPSFFIAAAFTVTLLFYGAYADIAAKVEYGSNAAALSALRSAALKHYHENESYPAVLEMDEEWRIDLSRWHGEVRSVENTDLSAPGALDGDTGKVLYDPSTGEVRVDCTHTNRYKHERWRDL